MSAECPFCRRPVDSRAVICPYCTSDLRYPERAFAPTPQTPQQRAHRTTSHVQGLGWELFARLIVVAPLAVLVGLPLLPVIAVIGVIGLLWMTVSSGGFGSGTSGFGADDTSASSASAPPEEEARSTKGVRWTPHRNSKRFPHVCWNCQTGCERRVAVCPQCGFSGFNGEGPQGARRG